jgi:beta-lactamase regulating signal transducer with metallopeptidase domain
MAIDRTIPMPTYLSWRSSMMPWLGAAWLAGVAAGLIRLAVAWRQAAVWRHAGTTPVSGDVALVAATLGRHFGLATPVEVRRSGAAPVPMVLGWRAPLILLPDRSLAVLRSEEVEAVLAHELAHIGRHDYAINLLQLLAGCLLFFHPGTRWLSTRIRIEREYACDDGAIEATGDRAALAHALAALDDTYGDCPVIVAALSGTLLDRLERIAGRPVRLPAARRGVLGMCAAGFAAAGVVAATLALPQRVPAGARLRSSRSPSGTVSPSRAGR